MSPVYFVTYVPGLDPSVAVAVAVKDHVNVNVNDEAQTHATGH